MASSAYARTAKMAASDPDRRRVFAFLNEEQQRRRIVDAADAGKVPVSAVSQPLLEKFDIDLLGTTAMRQFVGTVVTALLEEEGYEPFARNVRLSKDALFSSGSLYRRVDQQTRDEMDIIKRFVSVLSSRELDVIEKEILKRRATMISDLFSANTKPSAHSRR